MFYCEVCLTSESPDLDWETPMGKPALDSLRTKALDLAAGERAELART